MPDGVECCREKAEMCLCMSVCLCVEGEAIFYFISFFFKGRLYFKHHGQGSPHYVGRALTN